MPRYHFDLAVFVQSLTGIELRLAYYVVDATRKSP
jgi:hypothetical protein